MTTSLRRVAVVEVEIAFDLTDREGTEDGPMELVSDDLFGLLTEEMQMFGGDGTLVDWRLISPEVTVVYAPVAAEYKENDVFEALDFGEG